MTQNRHISTLTPCAGRCSTVFGDHVCRGCRRFNHEVIQWNTYLPIQQKAVWARLDAQLDQILIPMLPDADYSQVQEFIVSKRIRLLESASQGRKLYHALKICEKNKNLVEMSGLNIHTSHIKPLWSEFERRVLSLAEASYDFAWLRAEGMRNRSIALIDLE